MQIIRRYYTKSLDSKILTFTSLFLLSLFWLSSLFAIIADYSNVPFWDQWDAMLMMDPRISNVNFSTFWQQHNEHRIILGKTLFYFNNLFFNGSEIVLLLINLFLSTIIFLVICIYLAKANRKEKNLQIMIIGSLSPINFSLLSSQNLLWGFQAQFYLAILLPTLSFISFARYIVDKQKRNLILSIFLGVLSIGTMASGLMVLPVLLLLGIIFRLNKKENLIIFGLVCITFFGYFRNFSFVFETPLSIYLNHPIYIFKYVVLLLGGPVYVIAGNNPYLTLWVVLIFVYVISIPIINYCLGKYKKIEVHEVASFSIFIFILLFAIQTAGGRYEFGMSSALSSRYLLFSNIFLMIGIITVLFQLKHISVRLSIVTMLLMFALMLPNQLSVLFSKDNRVYDRNLAGLALNLEVNDETQLKSVYPWPERILSNVEKLKIEGRSVFGSKKYEEQRESFGKIFSMSTNKSCSGSIETSMKIPNSDWLQINGWLYSSVGRNIIVTNLENTIVGYGIKGRYRPDVANLFSHADSRSGFTVYVNTNFEIKDLKIISTDKLNNPYCLIKSFQPKLLNQGVK